MASNDFHVTDRELLLAADGELPPRRAAEIRDHLAACWGCRARMEETEKTISDFTRVYLRSLDCQLPPIAGPRARLSIQLSELVATSEAKPWQRFSPFSSVLAVAASLCVILLSVVLVGSVLVRHSARSEASRTVDSPDRALVPDRSLTPGVARSVTLGEVCSMAHEDVVRQVPTSLRQEVFQKYGIMHARANDYEIDYLITPGLGGAEDIRNLWPEPYTSPIWNARVKDALEEHLHEMVCTGKLDLPTAQRDIATDWIAAYKKYFHTNRPLSLSAGLLRTVGVSFTRFTNRLTL